ncbi:MAG: DUF6457 domain-containing protein [Actinomycetia bacterium]|nr:DUF6457 domain-containing protein [Actinomycetes bacterium]
MSTAPNEDEQRWAAWVQEATTSLGIDAGTVDIAAIHQLSKEVSHRLERPLVPVSAFVLGLAVGGAGVGGPLPQDEALRRLRDILPPEGR